MLFGDKKDFAIECYRDRWWDGYLFGRMCVWCNGQRLGDIDDSNILGVIQRSFEGWLEELPNLKDEAVDCLPDSEAFAFVDSRLFLDDLGLSDEQVSADAERFTKFCFLINWAENFDSVKAFVLKSNEGFRILYRLDGGQVGTARVSERGLREAVTKFLRWVEQEQKKA